MSSSLRKLKSKGILPVFDYFGKGEKAL